MDLKQQFSLKHLNSFNVQAICPSIYCLDKLEDLLHLPNLSNMNYYILGEGSNTLFVDQQVPIIIKPNFKGINVTETKDSYRMTIGAGENWHELVCYCLSNGIYGLENLALIPGSVGAAPVQNIGAYGVEFSDFCSSVKWYDFNSKVIKTLSNKKCLFAYRDSIFKQELHNQGIIIEVELNFPKLWKANLSYAGLSELGLNPTPLQVMEKVIQLRQAKLPDPEQLPNAGSFFKNPIVARSKLEKLQNMYPEIPYYLQPDDQIKLAAGWLIEKAGLKGYRICNVGVHENQALVLVNYGSNHGKDIIQLAQYVQGKVLEKFDICIDPEVRLITQQGEQNFSTISNRPEYQ